MLADCFDSYCATGDWAREQGRVQPGRFQLSLCTMVCVCASDSGGYRAVQEHGPAGELTLWRVHAVHGDLGREEAVLEVLAHQAGLVPRRRGPSWLDRVRWLWEPPVLSWPLMHQSAVNDWAADEKTTAEEIRRVLRCAAERPQG